MHDPVKVDVWSDVVCPWCYIGKRRFEEAVRTSGVPVEIEHHSFELSPDTPDDFAGTAVEALAESKGLPLRQAQAMVDQVTAIAAGVGLRYRFDRTQHTRTLRAHELLHLAKARGRQAETVEALFRAYFVDGGHVGRLDDLVALGASVGLDPDEVRAALTDHRYAVDVQADIAQATAFGITGVPFFVIDGRYGIAGAQESAVFAGALQQVAAGRTAAR